MRHTIQEAMKLTGRSRRSLYRDMDSGRLSYGIETNGRRYLDTTELMRIYGDLKGVLHTNSEEMAQVVTQADVPSLMLKMLGKIEALESQLEEQARRHSEELEAIRQELKETPRLEHKPEKTSTIETAPVPHKHQYSSVIERMKAKQASH